MNQPIATLDPQQLSAVAPWLENGDPVLLSPEYALPSRRCPPPLESLDAEALWREIHTPLAERAQFDLDRCEPSLRGDIETALRRLQQATIEEESLGSDRVLLCLVRGDITSSRQEQALDTRCIRYLIVRHGLPGALQLLLDVQFWRLLRKERWKTVPNNLYLMLEVESPEERLEIVADDDAAAWEFRRQLAAAPEAEWATCVQRIREALPMLHPRQQIVLALLVPDAPELAAEVVTRLASSAFAHQLSHLLPNLRDPAVIAQVIALRRPHGEEDDRQDFWSNGYLTQAVLHEFGSAALELLTPGIACNRTLWVLPRIGTPEALLALARATATDKYAHMPFTSAIERWPLATLAGLSEPLLVDNDKRLRHLRPQFTNLLQNQADNLPRLLPWLSPKAREALLREAGQLNLLGEQAGADELPGVLIDPPWLRPRTAKPARAISLPPLDQASNMQHAVNIASTLARRRSANRLQALQWLLARPKHAARGLIAPAVGKRCEARNHAATALRLLAGHGHEALILEVAALYDNAKVVEAVRALLAEDPLDLFPEKIAPLPEFWQPKQWTRLQLRDTGKLLPPEKLDALGQMMSFPTAGGLYPGLEQIRQACTPDSLAAFAWDCFLAWTQHDAPAKENWAMLMLGHLGNDDSARELMAWINGWALNGAVHRAVAALEVLVSLGSDRSLTLLDRLARKAPSTKLRECARERIRSIAEIRGLSEEELADRLVPTCDLDERSSLQLDFGPRQFTVVLDEQLQPWVRDANGTRLPTLPKANKSDDAQKSKAAASHFRRLKKEVGTIASEQLRRLESAMCSRRRWQAEAFRNCLVEHPLLRHLVQRLVWGVYEIEGLADEQSGFGGRLLQCFRIAEDGSATDASDAPIELPEGPGIRYGLPHQLELAPEETAAFAQLFADYQLLQPFVQLGRDTYALSAEERASGLITRHQAVRVASRRFFALPHRGWQRDMYHCSKPLEGGRLALLEFHPGLSPEEPEKVQTLTVLLIGTPRRDGQIPPAALSAEDLDPIAASELIRDLEYLCA